MTKKLPKSKSGTTTPRRRRQLSIVEAVRLASKQVLPNEGDDQYLRHAGVAARALQLLLPNEHIDEDDVEFGVAFQWPDVPSPVKLVRSYLEQQALLHEADIRLASARRKKSMIKKARRVEAQESGVWLLVSCINDWDVGTCASGVPGFTTFTEQAAALAAFRTHQAWLEADANLALEEVKGSDDYAGGFDVVNALLFVPFTHVSATTPPKWELLDDPSEYIVHDGSHSFNYDGGVPEEESSYVGDIDLQHYLPLVKPAAALPAKSKARR